MATRPTAEYLRDSGARFTVHAPVDDFKTFTEDMLAEMREGAESRMHRALDYTVRAVQWTLSAVYPVRRDSQGRLARSSPPGAPPGYIGESDERFGKDLRDSWRKGRVNWAKDKLELVGRYYSRHPAAGALEWGDPGRRSNRRTEFGSARAAAGMPARPYVRPTLIREADNIAAILDGSG